MSKLTAMQELIEWCKLNAFNIQGQDGVNYIAIDYEDMKEQLDYFLELEKQQLKDAMKFAIEEIQDKGDKWNDAEIDSYLFKTFTQK